jgi:hypothetical protein
MLLKLIIGLEIFLSLNCHYLIIILSLNYLDSIKSGDSKSICHHKEDGTQDYLNAFLKGLSQTPKTAKKVGKLVFNYLVLLSVGDKNGTH